MAAAQQFRRARARFLVIDAGLRPNAFSSHLPAFLSHDGVDPAEIRNGRLSSFRATRPPCTTERPNG
ncbi:hypothetical protein [Mesorhizobium sp. LjNodule214]|uniref:hypothetical protein n=1 Tax=Mesorhizobium sp. LjNodule214 TaxID=3342252 RepID=UPI003ECF8760